MPTTSDTAGYYVLYQYSPSLAGAIVATIAFIGLTSGHIWKAQRHHTKYFTPFIIGGFFEIIGFIALIASHFNEKSVPPYAVQSLFILLAPALFAASIYMILSRLIRRLDLEAAAVIPPRWLTRAFVSGDVFSFLLQCTGGGILATGNVDMINTGRNIIIGGLILQIIFFGFFFVTAVIFHKRAASLGVRRADVPWQRHLSVLYTVSILILVRSLVRVVEYAQGNDGYIISHEIFLYIFDALLMIAVMAVLLVWYVGDLQEVTFGRSRAREDSKHIPLASV